MIIVSDAGPILSFARAKKLDLLRQVVADLLIPNAVAEELGPTLLMQATWLKRLYVQDRKLIATLPQKLHLGECEALVLAKELNASLLIDEREARKVAQVHGITHYGSLRVLARAKELGLIPQIKPAVDDLIAAGTYIGDTLYQEFLHQVGED